MTWPFLVHCSSHLTFSTTQPRRRGRSRKIKRLFGDGELHASLVCEGAGRKMSGQQTRRPPRRPEDPAPPAWRSCHRFQPILGADGHARSRPATRSFYGIGTAGGASSHILHTHSPDAAKSLNNRVLHKVKKELIKKNFGTHTRSRPRLHKEQKESKGQGLWKKKTHLTFSIQIKYFKK